VTACYSCGKNAADPTSLPPREAIYDDGHWRVAHAFGSALPGWLVVVSCRHLTSLSQLTPDEATALGPLLQRLSIAVESVTSAIKCYVVFLAEAPGFEHLHVHIIPRAPHMPPDRTGIEALKYLAQPEGEWVSPEEMDRVSEDIQRMLRATTH